MKPMPEFPNLKGSPSVFKRMLKGTKTLLRLKKSPMPKILELVGKANVLGMVRHESRTLVIYDGKGVFFSLAFSLFDPH